MKKLTQTNGFSPFVMGRPRSCSRYNLNGKPHSMVFRLNFKKAQFVYPVPGADAGIKQRTQGWTYDVIEVTH